MDVSDLNELKAGCSSEEMRMFVVQKFKNIDKDNTDLEARLSETFDQVRLEMRDSVGDVDDKLKDFLPTKKYDKGLEDVHAL